MIYIVLRYAFYTVDACTVNTHTYTHKYTDGDTYFFTVLRGVNLVLMSTEMDVKLFILFPYVWKYIFLKFCIRRCQWWMFVSKAVICINQKSLPPVLFLASPIYTSGRVWNGERAVEAPERCSGDVAGSTGEYFLFTYGLRASCSFLIILFYMCFVL